MTRPPISEARPAFKRGDRVTMTVGPVPWRGVVTDDAYAARGYVFVAWVGGRVRKEPTAWLARVTP